eukprot:12500212-Ditylum_brightwellii.AAC.1
MKSPNFIHVWQTKEPKHKAVIDVSSPGFSPCDTKFKIIQRNDRTRQKETLNPTPEVLLHYWCPMWLIR